MGLTLHFHPLSSYCHKALIALYETGAAFKPLQVNLGDPASRDPFVKLWPVGKFPVLQDDCRNAMVPESSIIIEYVDRHYLASRPLVPRDAETAREVRLWDRFFDNHIHTHIQKIVGDRIRPAGSKDPFGVEHARAAMRTALDMIEERMATRTWMVGDDFTMADCSAAPALFYANKITPLADSHKHTAAYLERLQQRPSYARVLKEAEPFMHMFPKGD